MNDKTKEELIKNLASALGELSCEFLNNHINEGEKMDNVLSIIISGHISSLFGCLNILADENKELKMFFKKFKDDLMNHLLKNDFIEQMVGI